MDFERQSDNVRTPWSFLSRRAQLSGRDSFWWPWMPSFSEPAVAVSNLSIVFFLVLLTCPAGMSVNALVKQMPGPFYHLLFSIIYTPRHRILMSVMEFSPITSCEWNVITGGSSVHSVNNSSFLDVIIQLCFNRNHWREKVEEDIEGCWLMTRKKKRCPRASKHKKKNLIRRL